MNNKQFIIQEIQERISAGSLAPGTKLPSERALASEFGASRAAVQTALRALENQGLLIRLPNHRPVVLHSLSNGRPVKSKTADQIGIWILPDMQDAGGTMMLQGIRSVFGEHDYRLLIGCPPSYDREVIARAEVNFLYGLAKNPDIAGAIVWDTGNLGCAAVYRDLIEARLPLVFIDREPPCEVAADVVACNNRKAALNAVRHLLGLGHRRIAMVVGDENVSSVRERIEGYRLGLGEAGITPHPSWLLDLHLDQAGDPVAEAERLLTKTLSEPDSPTALFAANDRIALYLLEAAKNLRVGVPRDLSIVGFDWLLRWTPSGGEITTVAQPFVEIGRAAAQRVLDRIGAGSPESARQILLDAPLVVKNTTGAPFAIPLSTHERRVTGDNHEKAQSIYSH